VGGDQADDSAASSGAVYVFRRAGTTWQQEAYIKASDTGVGHAFGDSVALADNTLAVGAKSHGGSGQTHGAAYVFRRTGTAWQQQALIEASNAGNFDLFGTAVALSDDTLAVGAPAEDSSAQGVNANQADDGAQQSGAVYVFH
jgi:hypothetical protein